MAGSSKIKVVVVGTGGIAKTHMKAWMKIPDAKIVGACDIKADRAEAYAKECGATDWYVDFKKAVKSDCDVVDVCTPNKYHTPAVLAALAAGKDVLCEKPLAITPAEVEKIIAARDKAKKLVMTAHHMRFEGKSQALKKYVSDGCLGEVYYGRAWWLRRRMTPTWGVFADKDLSGGGPGIDVGVHCLDLAMHLMDNFKPVSVTGIAPCRLAKQPGIYNRWGDINPKTYQVEDLAVGLVRFANGAALSLEASWMLNMVEQETFKVSLFGDKAGAVYPDLVIADEKQRTLLNSTLADPPQIVGHEAEIQAFYDAVTKGLPSPVPPEQSLQVVKVIDGIYRSSLSGKEVKLN